MAELSNSVVLITGGGSGIGQAMANEFAVAGASVAVADIDYAASDKVAGKINETGGDALSIEMDITDRDSVNNGVDSIVDECGTVDILCNNAGILDDYSTLLETSEDLWDDVLDVNLKGMYLVTNKVLPLMLEGDDKGYVINTASVAGKVAGGGGIAYTASKHGTIGFTKQLSYDYGPDIRANAICPGRTETNINESIINDSSSDSTADTIAKTPAGRNAQPEEIAKVAVFLASEDSSFIHGTAIDVDGGWLTF